MHYSLNKENETVLYRQWFVIYRCLLRQVWLYHCKAIFSLKWQLYILQAEKLQNELSDVSYKMKSVEHQLHQAEDIKHDLQEKKEQVVQLRNQMEGEKLQRYVLNFVNGTCFLT